MSLVSQQGFDLTAERVRLAHHQANKTALEEKVLAGDLIPSEQALEMLETDIANARAKLLSLPVEAVQVAMASTELKDIEYGIRDLVYQALTLTLTKLSQSQS